MVVDRLPAGFEIENPRLVESGSIDGIEWLKSATQPEHSEFRDDRFVAAFNFSSSASNSGSNESGEGEGGDDSASAVPDAKAAKEPVLKATLAYIVRAVTPGKYVHPAATVEDMYRPERYARTAAGTLTVGGKE